MPRPKLATRPSRLLAGLAFAFLAPTPLCVVGLIISDPTHITAADLRGMLDLQLWGFFFQVGVVAMVVLGLPAWGVLYCTKSGWRTAATAGAGVGLAAVITLEALFRLLGDGQGFIFLLIGAVIGAIAAGGAWRIAYRAPERP